MKKTVFTLIMSFFPLYSARIGGDGSATDSSISSGGDFLVVYGNFIYLIYALLFFMFLFFIFTMRKKLIDRAESETITSPTEEVDKVIHKLTFFLIVIILIGIALNFIGEIRNFIGI